MRTWAINTIVSLQLEAFRLKNNKFNCLASKAFSYLNVGRILFKDFEDKVTENTKIVKRVTRVALPVGTRVPSGKTVHLKHIAQKPAL